MCKMLMGSQTVQDPIQIIVQAIGPNEMIKYHLYCYKLSKRIIGHSLSTVSDQNICYFTIVIKGHTIFMVFDIIAVKVNIIHF